jgi:hypothetical protein
LRREECIDEKLSPKTVTVHSHKGKCGGPTQKKKLYKLLAVEEGGGGFLGGPYSASLVAELIIDIPSF